MNNQLTINYCESTHRKHGSFCVVNVVHGWLDCIAQDVQVKRRTWMSERAPRRPPRWRSRLKVLRSEAKTTE